MIQETINQIETLIQESPRLSADRRNQLTSLLSQLKSELKDLEKTDQNKASKIADQTKIATEDFLSDETVSSDDLIDNLKQSIESFETSRPGLAQVINSICVTLSNLGI